MTQPQRVTQDIDLAVVTRFVRARETVDCALNGSNVPLLVEPDLDEIRAGVFDGQPIGVYSAWKDEHPHGARFPQGESLDDATSRYANALRRLMGRPEVVTLIVGHELAIRYIVDAAACAHDLGVPGTRIANAMPYFFDEAALRKAAERLDAFASPASPDGTPTEVAH